ncbi:uncharacterized protein MONOS_5104 [Monocercomonoides exilis]|uniref:uncharacterized protein n=1 Tax=Monocercomonoides exilis TaxID=2049356 RepID=UPI00355AAA61|nr:hypothetical protein MONOS_5104 [Monocercomonoides exilis]|eukprot:MONOS_5104.1-p1 / transcript=MONOS_5104.1 / gene=MONOS_5104 / organism=Monocercomonoides_exilis_PA203 / gene_product=unspecified product / transcript_product=unspecified product / location=Mono_scaffold00145:24958-29985(+) / protein_length=1675 / sequence_SO=supercontig / SO=protein_coding / is_pseudo=false
MSEEIIEGKAHGPASNGIEEQHSLTLKGERKGDIEDNIKLVDSSSRSAIRIMTRSDSSSISKSEYSLRHRSALSQFENGENYPCHISGCDRSFTTRQNLMRHLRMKHNIKPNVESIRKRSVLRKASQNVVKHSKTNFLSHSRRRIINEKQIEHDNEMKKVKISRTRQRKKVFDAQSSEVSNDSKTDHSQTRMYFTRTLHHPSRSLESYLSRRLEGIINKHKDTREHSETRRLFSLAYRKEEKKDRKDLYSKVYFEKKRQDSSPRNSGKKPSPNNRLRTRIRSNAISSRRKHDTEKDNEKATHYEINNEKDSLKHFRIRGSKRVGSDSSQIGDEDSKNEKDEVIVKAKNDELTLKPIESSGDLRNRKLRNMDDRNVIARYQRALRAYSASTANPLSKILDENRGKNDSNSTNEDSSSEEDFEKNGEDPTQKGEKTRKTNLPQIEQIFKRDIGLEQHYRMSDKFLAGILKRKKEEAKESIRAKESEHHKYHTRGSFNDNDERKNVARTSGTPERGKKISRRDRRKDKEKQRETKKAKYSSSDESNEEETSDSSNSSEREQIHKRLSSTNVFRRATRQKPSSPKSRERKGFSFRGDLQSDADTANSTELGKLSSIHSPVHFHHYGTRQSTQLEKHTKRRRFWRGSTSSDSSTDDQSFSSPYKRRHYNFRKAHKSESSDTQSTSSSDSHSNTDSSSDTDSDDVDSGGDTDVARGFPNLVPVSFQPLFYLQSTGKSGVPPNIIKMQHPLRAIKNTYRITHPYPTYTNPNNVNTRENPRHFPVSVRLPQPLISQIDTVSSSISPFQTQKNQPSLSASFNSSAVTSLAPISLLPHVFSMTNTVKNIALSQSKNSSLPQPDGAYETVSGQISQEESTAIPSTTKALSFPFQSNPLASFQSLNPVRLKLLRKSERALGISRSESILKYLNNCDPNQNQMPNDQKSASASNNYEHAKITEGVLKHSDSKENEHLLENEQCTILSGKNVFVRDGKTIGKDATSINPKETQRIFVGVPAGIPVEVPFQQAQPVGVVMSSPTSMQQLPKQPEQLIQHHQHEEPQIQSNLTEPKNDSLSPQKMKDSQIASLQELDRREQSSSTSSSENCCIRKSKRNRATFHRSCLSTLKQALSALSTNAAALTEVFDTAIRMQHPMTDTMNESIVNHQIQSEGSVLHSSMEDQSTSPFSSLSFSSLPLLPEQHMQTSPLSCQIQKMDSSFGMVKNDSVQSSNDSFIVNETTQNSLNSGLVLPTHIFQSTLQLLAQPLLSATASINQFQRQLMGNKQQRNAMPRLQRYKKSKDMNEIVDENTQHGLISSDGKIQQNEKMRNEIPKKMEENVVQECSNVSYLTVSKDLEPKCFDESAFQQEGNSTPSVSLLLSPQEHSASALSTAPIQLPSSDSMNENSDSQISNEKNQKQDSNTISTLIVKSDGKKIDISSESLVEHSDNKLPAQPQNKQATSQSPKDSNRSSSNSSLIVTIHRSMLAFSKHRRGQLSQPFSSTTPQSDASSENGDMKGKEKNKENDKQPSVEVNSALSLQSTSGSAVHSPAHSLSSSVSSSPSPAHAHVKKPISVQSTHSTHSLSDASTFSTTSSTEKRTSSNSDNSDNSSTNLSSSSFMRTSSANSTNSHLSTQNNLIYPGKADLCATSLSSPSSSIEVSLLTDASPPSRNRTSSRSHSRSQTSSIK